LLGPLEAAAVAVVYKGGPTRIERTGEHGLDTIVRPPFGSFKVRVQRMTGLVSIVWPYDAPPFVRHDSHARLAVRARVYDLAKRALEELSVEDLLKLAPRGLADGSPIQSRSA
jgi:hypothetical protein